MIVFMEVVTDQKRIEGLLTRYVQNIFPSKEKAMELFKSGQQLTFYFGVDPTGPDIHLGNATNLLWIKKLISLGHKAILLIGDFTARVGDPTGEESVRRALSEKEIKNNMKSYIKQAEKILSKGSFEVKYNSAWFKKMSLEYFIKLIGRFSVQQMIIRDMFQERIKENKPIYTHEFVYPIMQGYDSVAMGVDGEVGGNDQTFNMLIGRDLVKEVLKKDKIVVTTKLLVNPATNKKIMNKSEGGYISLNDLPQDVFGKVMAMPDTAILPLFENATELPEDKLYEIKARMERGENPKILKEKLGYEIVKLYHGEKDAKKAKEEFERVFSERQIPQEIPKWRLREGHNSVLDAVTQSELASSRTEVKRLLQQRAITVNGEVITDWSYRLKKGDTIKVGSRKFLKIN